MLQEVSSRHHRSSNIETSLDVQTWSIDEACDLSTKTITREQYASFQTQAIKSLRPFCKKHKSRRRLKDGALTLDIDGLDVEVAFLHAHFGREGGGRLPLGGGTGGGLLHHLVDLLEGEALKKKDMLVRARVMVGER